jgi:hypothetical protein
MARNPAPLIIPYHRGLAAGGKIGGFLGARRRRQKSACSSSRAFASRRRQRFSGLLILRLAAFSVRTLLA